ncbi:MAG TPA: hypothetical protein VJR27_00640 [Candidatus Saccharimonadales bacterium]|nr:hypothetical protein [Candidatus Saccharimonadales bacterium]
MEFQTFTEAHGFVKPDVEKPVMPRHETLKNGATFRAFPEHQPDGTFTNIFDVSYDPLCVQTELCVLSQPESIFRLMQHTAVPYTAMSSCGFFFLADQYSSQPRQISLNLAMSEGRIYSLPVADGEVLLCQGGKLEARTIRAMGGLILNGAYLSWTGSRTTREANCYIYGNGNSVIRHRADHDRGSIRELEDTSTLTPPLDADSELVDVGFTSIGSNVFKGMRSKKGGLDIFSHDLVVRCPERYIHPSTSAIHETPLLRIATVDSLNIRKLDGAVSVGPQLADNNIEQHPVNKDPSLGSKPPFVMRRMARMALYQTTRGLVHIRLYDGIVGSEQFPGVTPNEVVQNIVQEDAIAWGCFLDPGKTSKLCVRTEAEVESHGNRDYIRWPNKPGGPFTWQRQAGRAVSSYIGLL